MLHGRLFAVRHFTNRRLMLRTVFVVALSLAIAIGGGAASVWYALKMPDGLGAVSIGPWTTFPDLGTPDADPYSKARIAREGVLSLGLAEGLTFVAQRDFGRRGAPAELHLHSTGHLPAGQALDALRGRDLGCHPSQRTSKAARAAFDGSPTPGRQLDTRDGRPASGARQLGARVRRRPDVARPDALRQSCCQQRRHCGCRAAANSKGRVR